MRRFAKPLYGLTPVPRVRIPLPPPRSLDCRELLPRSPARYAKHARISRLFLSKPDCRERTAWHQVWSLSSLFSRRHRRSPVSQGSSGEGNAITCRVFGNSELTFVSTLGLPARSGILYRPVIEGPRPQRRGTLCRLGEDVSRRDRNSGKDESARNRGRGLVQLCLR